MSGQSKVASFIESLSNVAIGYDATSQRIETMEQNTAAGGQARGQSDIGGSIMADTATVQWSDEQRHEPRRILSPNGFREILDDQRRCGESAGWWLAEPDVGRVADGVSTRMDCIGGVPIQSAPTPNPKKSKASRVHRLRCLGNAVVPQIPEIIGRAIMKIEGRIAE